MSDASLAPGTVGNETRDTQRQVVRKSREEMRVDTRQVREKAGSTEALARR